MRDFFDTSVLVAVFRNPQKHSACGLHTLAELYASMTAIPVHPRVLPEQAMLFVEEARNRLATVSLNDQEYLETIWAASELGFSSGRVYDALLLRCARKSQAHNIYTWNVKHFQSTAPDLASRIRTP
jgi:predicted nucleic acid-binding protein